VSDAHRCLASFAKKYYAVLPNDPIHTLFAAKADVNATNDRDGTALMRAAT
jgi:hypothetical protein